MARKSLQGFQAIPVKFLGTSSAQHDLFIKEHSVRNQSADKPPGRTLFVLNVPPWVTKESFERAFSVAGPVNSVIIQEKSELKQDAKDGGFKIAYIVYKKPAGVLNALKLKTIGPLSTDDHPITTGIAKWVEDYNNSIYDHEKLQQDVNAFMETYDKEVEEQKNVEKVIVTDDDGWTTVTKRGRNPGLSRKESVENKLIQKTAIKRKKKELTNFYRFQIRESKMKHLELLRKKFEEDKKKITSLKEARKFKPF